MRLHEGVMVIVGGALLSVCAACDEEEIHAYSAPKPSRASAVDPLATDGSDRPMVVMDWEVPRGWRSLPNPDPMRAATFEARGPAGRLEIAVSRFPSPAGGLRANINRWRRQIGLELIKDQDLSAQLSRLTNQGVHGFVVDMTGPVSAAGQPQARRLVGAILHDDNGMTWFVKAMDDPSIVAAHQKDIRTFAGSFHLKTEGPPESDGPVTWDAPAHWVLDPDPSSTRFARAVYYVTHDAEKAKVTITPLSGDGGGALANINRWRTQLGLSPMTRLADQPVERFRVADLDAVLVELVSAPEVPQQRRRFLVAILAQPRVTWFIKMIGQERLVADEKAAFEAFVRSFRFEESGG